MADSNEFDGLRDELQTAWHRHIDMLVPIRPSLFSYCRRLTNNVCDAEDLVQDPLPRAFGRWAVTYPEIREPRAYLLRVATNIWIDTQRRRQTEARLIAANTDTDVHPRADALTDSTDLRDAGSRLLELLSQHERAAIVLKEVFDMTLEEIAGLLATTTGAVKTALHRGRYRLHESDSGAVGRRQPSSDLLDRFIERLNAKDVAGMLALMLEGASSENVGNSFYAGLDPSKGLPHFVHKAAHGHAEWPP
jgi:RNA polymerase sigma-70 factor (ECF subfamily)